MSLKITFAAFCAFAVISAAGAAQAKTYAWEENIRETPVLAYSYSRAGDGEIYENIFNSFFAKEKNQIN